MTGCSEVEPEQVPGDPEPNRSSLWQNVSGTSGTDTAECRNTRDMS